MARIRYLTAGESHGKALTVIVEGIPAGLALSAEAINQDLRRRQGGYGRGGRMAIEQDTAEVLSGIRHGLSMGSPISLLIRNRDWENWQDIMSDLPVDREIAAVTNPRPGHADLPGALKYGFHDIRPVIERSSARETAARVAAGAIARRLIAELGITVKSHTVAIGGYMARPGSDDWGAVEKSPLRCMDPEAEAEMKRGIDDASESGDTLGGITEVVACGVPLGLGSYAHWDRRLDGRIAQAMMSINSVKGVEVGGGFESAGLRGSAVHDALNADDRSRMGWRREGNRAGGIEGGITNGEPVVVRLAVKPVPTLRKPLQTVDIVSRRQSEAHTERGDVCVVPAAGVIGEAMLCLVLANEVLEKFGGDSLGETLRNYKSYMESISIKDRNK